MFIKFDNLHVDDLRLDPDNPRLPTHVNRDEADMLRFLAESSSIEELISAIGSNGYFGAEPLIGIQDANGGRTIIVEGNRRLTALKLLNRVTYEGIPKKVLDAVNSAKERPTSVNVALYETRSDILNCLGNKHIAGVKPWGALAKARYAKQLLDTTPMEDEIGERVRAVAQSIGSRSDFISRSIKAYEAYQYAEKRGFFGLQTVNEETVKFSLLGTALDYDGIQQFVYDDVDIDFDSRTFKEAHLKELFSWMFEKTDKGKTRLGESRNLKELSKVVASEEGLRLFRTGVSLDQAFRLTDGIEQDYDSLSSTIYESLREANSIVADVKRSDQRFDMARSIVKQSIQLRNAFDGEQ